MTVGAHDEDKQITIDVPGRIGSPSLAFYGRFLAGAAGCRGGPRPGSWYGDCHGDGTGTGRARAR